MGTRTGGSTRNWWIHRRSTGPPVLKGKSMAEQRRIRPQDDPASWSYYGAAHRYDIHGDPAVEAACEQRMDRLVIERREDELRALSAGGDRCAFIALIE